MAAPVIMNPKDVMPAAQDFEKILTTKLSYEAAQKTPNKDAWNKDRAHWHYVPWGIAFEVSIGKYKRMVAAKQAGKRVYPKQNYDVIDSVARNGVLSIPTVTVDFSIGVLFNKLIKYNNFFLIIIHSALEEDVREGSTPNEFCQPIYEVGKGEITAVFYRFISTYFFGYMGILGESDCDHVYDL
jgi:hypothetical protein